MKFDAVFVLENAGWPALLVGAGGVILRANPSAVKIFGPVVEGEKPKLAAIWVEQFGPAPEMFLAHWERSPEDAVPLSFKVKGGGTRLFTVCLCSFSRDSQKYFLFQLLPASPPARAGGQTEMLSIHKHKLDCALQLARSMSHDFNNALTGVLGHTSLLLSQMPPDHPWRDSLKEVEKAVARASEIACDLAAFSRQEKKEPRGPSAGNLNLLAQRSVDTAKQSHREAIEWTVKPARDLFAARFDEPKMLQAFVKILDNAVEACGAGGRISISTRNVELSEAAQDRALRLLPGNYVCAEITDNGSGIAPEALPRIFEPFFTTKKESGHRGLGLALVYGIVTNHGGGVAVSSQPSGGTSVRVYLPAETSLARSTKEALHDLRGSQTILLVDDEDLMLSLGKTVLTTFGYRVLTANSGPKALSVLEHTTVPVDLVITDLVMPTMTGRELVEKVGLLAPEARVLQISGIARSNGEDKSAYLQKPFSSQDLLLKVKETLSV